MSLQMAIFNSYVSLPEGKGFVLMMLSLILIYFNDVEVLLLGVVHHVYSRHPGTKIDQSRPKQAAKPQTKVNPS